MQSRVQWSSGVLSALIGPLFVLSACGGSQSAAETPEGEAVPSTEQAAPEAQPAEAASTEDGDDVDAELAQQIAEAEGTGNDPNAERDVLYKMTSDGLMVEVDDLQFAPKAEPVSIRGGWGVKISVEVKGMGTEPRYLLTPDGAPLAFAGVIKRKKGDEEFGDKRGETAGAVVQPGEVKSFSRTWPAKGQTPLYSGDDLRLEVGLWGLGRSEETRRALRRFFSLRMVAGNRKPQPVIQPPEGVE